MNEQKLLVIRDLIPDTIAIPKIVYLFLSYLLRRFLLRFTTDRTYFPRNNDYCQVLWIDKYKIQNI